ncbi:hypothetical protein MBLNU457_1303t1 [Dothideomycetes sp. NU457]
MPSNNPHPSATSNSWRVTQPIAFPSMATYTRLSAQAQQANTELGRKARRFQRLQAEWEEMDGREKKGKRGLMFIAQREHTAAQKAAATAARAANDCFAQIATAQAAALQQTAAALQSTSAARAGAGVYVVPAKRQVQPRSSLRPTARPFVPRRIVRERDQAQLAGLFDKLKSTEPVAKRLRSASSSLPDGESLSVLSPKKRRGHARAVSDGAEAVKRVGKSDGDIEDIVEAYAGKVKKD